MTIDLSREFKDIDLTEWESPQQRQEYIHLTVVSALSLVVDSAMGWLEANVADSRWRDAEVERRFYEASLMSIFAERVTRDAQIEWCKEQARAPVRIVRVDAEKHIAWAEGPNPFKEMVNKAAERSGE